MITLQVELHDHGPELWPESFTPAGEKVGYSHKVLETYRDGGALSPEEWEALFQQEPVPAGGGVLKEEWWVKTSPADYPVNIKSAAIFVDSAFKTGVRNDFSVFSLWLKGQDGQAYLKDVLRIREETTEVQYQLELFYRKHQAIKPKIYIEDKASGQGIIQGMRKVWAYVHPDGRVQKFSPLPIIAYKIPRGMGGKEQQLTARVDAVAQYVQARLCHVPENAPWLPAWVFEHNRVPKGQHDDQVITTLMMLETWFATTQIEIPASRPMVDKDVQRKYPTGRRSNFKKRQRELYEQRELDKWIEAGYDVKTGQWRRNE